MGSDSEIAAILRGAGHKLTPQRMLIVRAVREAQGHISAAEIADRVHEDFPSVDVSTVYRTLEVLKSLRLVTATDLGEGDTVFEWTQAGPHHHLVCTACGGKTEIAHHHLEALEQTLDHEFGFEANLDHFAIFGLCAHCRQNGNASANAS